MDPCNNPDDTACQIQAIVGSVSGMGWGLAWLGIGLTVAGGIATLVLWRLRSRMPGWLAAMLAFFGAIPTLVGGVLIALVGGALIFLGRV